MYAVCDLYDRIINNKLLIRRINISINHLIKESDMPQTHDYEQLDFFSQQTEQSTNAPDENSLRERKKQEAMIKIKQRYGKNSIIKGMNLEEGATTVDRNRQIGGHKA